MGCCAGKQSGSSGVALHSNAAVGKKPGTAISAMGGAGKPPATAKGTNANNSQAATAAAGGGILNQQEQKHIRAREKAIQALVESFKDQEALVPSAKWRRQYIKVAGLGPGVATAIAERLSSSTSLGRKGNGGPGLRPPLAKDHGILTLDLRALKIGDDGFAALASALLEDRVVQNVILSGNQITDVGAKSFVAAMTAASSTPSEANVAAAQAKRPADTAVCPSQVRLLVLADNPISSVGLGALASCLHKLPVLERLEIGRGQTSEESACEGDHVTEDTVRALIQLIAASTTLQTLVFKGTGNPCQTDFSPAGLTTFLTEVVGSSRLSSLFLQECYTTKPVAVPASTVFKNRRKNAATASPSVPVASSSADAKLSLQPISALSSALTLRTTQLNTLVLRFPLSDSAMAVLCKGIAHAILLANLSLRGCDLSAAGLRLLGDALRSNRTITALDISYQSQLIAHPAVLAELRNSSKRRQSYMMSYTESRDNQSSSGPDSVPSREEREHPLLPIIQVLHTNRTIAQLIMLGVNISTDDVEELCSCVEQSNNHVLTDVAYTSIGADALNMKLENFLSANREYGSNIGVSAVSQRSLVRGSSTGTLFADTVTDRTQASEYSPHASTAAAMGAAGTGNVSALKGVGPPPPGSIPYHLPNSRDSVSTVNASMTTTDDLAGTSMPTTHRNSKGSLGGSAPALMANSTQPFLNDVTTPDEVELRVGVDSDGMNSPELPAVGVGYRPYGSVPATTQEGSEAGTAPYLSRTDRQVMK